MRKRNGFTSGTRFAIFKRDGFVCQYCGAHPPQVILHVDHIVAVSCGGSNDADNLVTACAQCNGGKGAKPLQDVPQSLRDKASDIAESESQLRGYHEIIEAKRSRLENEAWQIAEELRPGCSKDGFPKIWLRSIRTFVERLGYHEVLDAMERADARGIPGELRTWQYFCGICWGKIRQGVPR